MTNDPNHFEQNLFEKLLNSELLITYQNAFRSATGLPLRLVSSDLENWCLDDQAGNRSPFCVKLNLCKTACHSCIEVNHRLMSEAKVSGPTTCHCFAGMAASAVPVRNGATLIGFLKTGQVFHSVPEPAAFEAVSKTLARQGLREEEIQALHSYPTFST